MHYQNLVKIYDVLYSVSKRLDKTFVLAEFLKTVKDDDLEFVLLLLQGRIFPNYDKRNIGIANNLIIKALSKITSYSESDIEKMWKKQGDIGEVAELVMAKKKQASLLGKKDLDTKHIIDQLRKLVEISGKGTVDTKMSIISTLLVNASNSEAKYLVRTILEDLRIGSGSGVLRDALIWAYLPRPLPIFKIAEKLVLPVDMDEKHALALLEKAGITEKEKLSGIKLKAEKSDDAVEEVSVAKMKDYDYVECASEEIARHILNHFTEEVQSTIDASNDFHKVAKALKDSGLEGTEDIDIVPLRPLKVMLAPKVNSVKEGFEALGKPAAFELKLDGFRMLIHRKGNVIKLFTRRLDEVSHQFPDVIKVVKEHIKSDEYIIDAEVIGIDPKTKQVRPFQEISQRIKRKYDIEQLEKDLPVVVCPFDVIYLDGKSCISTPFNERRHILVRIVKEQKHKIELVEQLVTDDEKKAQKFYDDALKNGYEGVMIKMLSAPYKPGARVGYMVKLKPVMESLDLTIVEAEYGTGKRAGWFSSFTLACLDKKTNTFKEIGKVGTGIKEKSEEGVSFDDLTKMLKKHIVSEEGRLAKIKPSVVIEIDYQEIQKSPSYSSGYALRFPRLKRLRDDKGPYQCSELSYIEKLYKGQTK